MKNLVVTRADDKIKDMCNITHPIIRKYAQKCDANFKIISDDGGYHPHYRILQLYDLFKEYDRILVLDSDVLILKNCPDIFQFVPPFLIGSIFEDKGSRQEDRRNRIKKIQDERENIGWSEGYINSGVIIFSKMHRDLFNLKKENLWMNLGYDDIEIGFQINKNKYKIHELSYKFNFMSMFCEDWSNKKKSEAYILHYAGGAFHRQIDRTEQIIQDYLVLKKYNLLF